MRYYARSNLFIALVAGIFISLVGCDNALIGDLASPSSPTAEAGPFGFIDLNKADLSSTVVSNISGLKGLSGPSPVVLDGRGGSPFELAEARNPDPNSLAFDNIRPYSLSYNQDGSRLFALNRDSSIVYQYSLTKPYDTANASLETSISFSSEDTTGTSIAFSSDGSKFYLMGRDSERVHQYDLSTPFELQSASYDSFYFVGAVASSPFSLSFNPNGSKMFVLSNFTDCAYEYSLSTNFDVTSASYTATNFCFGAQDASVQSLFFGPDGSELFMLGSGTDSIYKYSLPTPFDLSVVNYDFVSFSVSDQLIWPYSLLFSPGGDRLLVVGRETQAIFQYKLSTGYDLGSAVYETLPVGLNSYSLQTTAQDSFPVSFSFSADGNKLFVLGRANNAVYQYTLASAFDVTSAQYDGVQFSVLPQEASPFMLRFSTDGTKMFIGGSSAPLSVHQYILTAGFDLTTASFDATLDISANVTLGFSAPSIDFNSSGNKMFVLSNGSFVQYNLGTDFDIASATFDPAFYSGGIVLSTNFVMNRSGDTAFLMTREFGYLEEFSLSTPNDISTSASEGIVHWTGTQDRTVFDIRFNAEGSEFFILGAQSKGIYRQYIGNGGGPEYRVCFDRECNEVKHDWRQTSDVLVVETDYIEVRTNSSALGLTKSVISVEIGNLSDDWTIVTE